MEKLKHTVKQVTNVVRWVILIILLLVFVLLLTLVWSFNEPFWNVLDLVVIPAVLAIGIYWLNRAQRNSEREIEKRREQETILQNYLDRMTGLILDNGLGKLKPGHEIEQYLDGMKQLLFEGELDSVKEASLRDELWSGFDEKVTTIARTLTLTTLRRLDGDRKGVLLRFLYEAELIIVKENRLGPTLNLRNADLTGSDLSEVFLSGADLTGVNLSETNLSQTDLSWVTLTDTNFAGAKLSRAYLRGANLTFAKLPNACLDKANLYGANLQSTLMSGANLRNADLRDADLRGADLNGADMLGANLEGAIYDNETVWPNGYAPPSKAVRADQ